MAKIGLFSDVHANFEALTAVIARLEEEHCEKIYCLGDVVGYGASPSDCIKLLRKKRIPTIKGNHDDYASDIFGELGRHLRDEIREAIAWTQKNLSFDEAGWLADLPMEIPTPDFTMIHSSFAKKRWAYCLDEVSFLENFSQQKVQLAFCGHSHMPMVGLQAQEHTLPHLERIAGQSLPTDGKIMVNVGSAGQPRDHDTRAGAVIYDTDSRVVSQIRVDYDLETARQKILDAKLPERFAQRLAIGH